MADAEEQLQSSGPPGEMGGTQHGTGSLSPLRVPKVKLDHLGKPLKEGKQRYRYARTCTIVYDGAGSAESAAAEKTWRLLQDARRALDLSAGGLQALFRIFQRHAPAKDHAFMDAMAFRRSFHQYFKRHGVRDMILVRRLFANFKEKEEDESANTGDATKDDDTDNQPRIDFRQFVRILASMSREFIEDRVDVLFEVWDADESGTLSFTELASHVTHDLPIDRVEGAMEEFAIIWGQIKRYAANARRAAGEEVEEDPFSSGGIGSIKKDVNAAELEKQHLVAACAHLPAVRYFFEDLLTHKPPKADELARGNLQRNFQARLRELDAEVYMEVKAGIQGESERSERPQTTASGARPLSIKQVKQQEVQKKLKEQTDAMLKTVDDSLAFTQSSSAKAIFLARQEVRPRTSSSGGDSLVKSLGSPTGRGKRPATRSLHGFVRPSASMAELAPLNRSR